MYNCLLVLLKWSRESYNCLLTHLGVLETVTTALLPTWRVFFNSHLGVLETATTAFLPAWRVLETNTTTGTFLPS